MSNDFYWAYDNKKDLSKALDACNKTKSKSKKSEAKKITKTKTKTKKIKKHLKLDKNKLKQENLDWFITEQGKKTTPSPIEDRIRTFLNGCDVDFFTEVSFNGLNPTGQKTGFLRFDFYIPEKKIAIEYDGKKYHKDDSVKKRDYIKKVFCEVNGIFLKRYNSEHLEKLESELIRLLK